MSAGRQKSAFTSVRIQFVRRCPMEAREVREEGRFHLVVVGSYPIPSLSTIDPAALRPKSAASREVRATGRPANGKGLKLDLSNGQLWTCGVDIS